MDVDYFYCNECGYEDENIFVAFSNSCASGDLYYCPICGNLVQRDMVTEREIGDN